MPFAVRIVQLPSKDHRKFGLLRHIPQERGCAPDSEDEFGISFGINRSRSGK